jgi:hypothetical protein
MTLTAGGESEATGLVEAVRFLRTPEAIRQRSEAILARGLAGELSHFLVDTGRLSEAADRVVAVTRRDYPSLQIPVHGRFNHFRAGAVDRVALLDAELARLPPAERDRARCDLVVTSVFLDAGAGAAWRYREQGGGVYARSEGLAVASWHAFRAGGFSAVPGEPWRADAERLERMDEAALGALFQVGTDNPLVGLAGRVALLRRLGAALRRQPALFGAGAPRIGNLVDHLRTRAAGGAVRAATVLAVILEGFAPMWPGRLELGGENLGDVWRHPAAGGSGPSAGLVPFHKLSQWLTYSLVEPLASAGLRVSELEALTGLPEYRNGGLLIDTGVLVPRHPEVTGAPHRPDEEVIVEWRALTVALLDRLAERVRAQLGKTPAELPLARILEGGTWSAGRELARERRPGGEPPIAIDSDGTVF